MGTKIARQDTDRKYDPYVLIGVDEVGSGSLVGPIVACAAMASPHDAFLMEHVRDSKKMSPKMRKEVAAYVHKLGMPFEFGEVSHTRVDEVNPLRARLEASCIAVRRLVYRYWETTQEDDDVAPPLVIVDGDCELPLGGFCQQEAVIKADDTFLVVGLASILAKVHRDRLVEAWSTMYPEYRLARNKGYGTAEHLEALKKYGPSPIHRDVRPVRKARLDRHKLEAALRKRNKQ